MSLFSHKTKSSLPQEILGSVHTMKDDLDGKAATPQSMQTSMLPVSEGASPFTFSAAPAMKNMEPVNENGLTSPITITNTDTSQAKPDPKESSPFLTSDVNQSASRPEATTLSLDTLQPKPNPLKERARGASFVNENATLGAETPVYAAPVKKNTHIFMAGIILLVLAVVAGGAFAYFTFFAKKPVDVAPIEVTPDMSLGENLSDAMVVKDTTQTTPFSLSSPNYLSIDVETITAEQFRMDLREKEALFESNNIINTAVEFFITDKSNNPIAFTRFATLMGITFPQEVLDEIEESFSVYLYSDNRIPRVGLSLSVKNKDALQSVVKKDESAIPFALQSLYLDPSVTKITTGTFREGIYKTYDTRYFNIDDSGLSNDYTFTGKHWVIGTSQKAFQKILDIFEEDL